MRTQAPTKNVRFDRDIATSQQFKTKLCAEIYEKIEKKNKLIKCNIGMIYVNRKIKNKQKNLICESSNPIKVHL